MKKYFFIFLVGLFFFSLVSGLSFNNVKVYNNQTETATIKESAFGATIANATLKTPKVFKVGYGDYFKVAEFEYVNYYDGDYNNFISNMKIINLNTGKEENKPMIYKYKVLANKTFTEKEFVCEVVAKGANQSCSYLDKNVSRIVEEWIPLEKFTVSKGQSITVGLFTYVNKGDTYEWIPTLAGQEVPEWAVWTSDLEVGLIRYFQFNETTGSVAVDSMNNGNGTINASVVLGATGKIDYAYNFTATNSMVGLLGGHVNATSLNFWVFPNSYAASETLFFYNWGANNLAIYQNIGGYINYYDGRSGADRNTTIKAPLGQYSMITVVYNGTGTLWYLNNGTGVYVVNGVISIEDIGGRSNSGAQAYAGTLDEIGIWNRTLSQSERDDLYNNGAGLRFRGSTGPTVVLYSPTNNANYSTYSHTFTCSAVHSAGLQNVSLVINGLTVSTNTSQLNNTNYTFNYNLTSTGTYVWNCLAFSQTNLSGQATNYTLIYSPSVPSINLTSPANNAVVNSPSQNFVCGVISQDGLQNVSLMVNGTRISTNTSRINNTNYTFNYNLPSTGLYNWTCEAVSHSNVTLTNTTTFNITYANDLQVSQVSPVDYYNMTLSSVNLVGYAKDDTAIINVSLLWNGVREQTNTSGLNNTNYTFSKTVLVDGVYLWGVEACDALACAITNNRTITRDTTAPVISANITAGSIIYNYGDNVTIAFSLTETNPSMCWYNYAGANTTFSCATTSLNVSSVYGYTNITFYANDTVAQNAVPVSKIFAFDSTPPTITLTAPELSQLFYTGEIDTEYLNWTVNDTNLNYSGCFYQYNNTYEVLYGRSSLPAQWFDGNDSNYIAQTSNVSIAVPSSVKYLTIKHRDGTASNTTGDLLIDYIYLGDLEDVDGFYNMSINYSGCGFGCTRNYLRGNVTSTPVQLKSYTLSSAIGDFDIPSEMDTWRQYINCSLNTTTFILDPYSRTINFTANDTIGNTATTSRTWVYKVSYVDETYDDEVAETALATFGLDLLYTSSDWTAFSGVLVYNGTSYTATGSNTVSTVSFTRNIDVPLTNGTDMNFTFFWNITFTNSSGSYSFVTPNKNQSVTAVTFDICGVNETPIISFFTKSATNTSLSVNASIESYWELFVVGGTGDSIKNDTYTDSSGNNSRWDFCISPNSTNYTVSVNFEATAPLYAPANYYIDEADYDGSTDNITLYLLNDSLATLTELVVQDRSQNGVEGVDIFIQAYDIATDTYYTVEMARTDYEGSDLKYLNWYDTWYKFIGVLNGTVIFSDGPTKISATPKEFTYLVSDIYNYTKFEDVLYSLTYNNATENFVLTYVIPSAEVTAGCLRVIKTNWTNQYEICNTCETSSSATIYCNIGSEGNGTFIAEFYATGSLWIYDRLIQLIGVSAALYDELGNDEASPLAIIAAGLVTSLFLISPVLAIVGALAGLGLTYALGLQPFDLGVYAGIVLFGGFIIWLLKK